MLRLKNIKIRDILSSCVWIVYLIECNDGSLYCGVTTDLDRRIEEHNSGKGSKYTRGRTPVKLRACLGKLLKCEAYRIERYIKSLSSEKKINALRRLRPEKFVKASKKRKRK